MQHLLYGGAGLVLAQAEIDVVRAPYGEYS